MGAQAGAYWGSGHRLGLRRRVRAPAPGSGSGVRRPATDSVTSDCFR